jgi:hypothetical protein
MYLRCVHHCYFVFFFVICLFIQSFCLTLQPQEQKMKSMTAVQLNALNAQIWRDMGVLADSESMMKRVAKYLSKLVKEKKDPTLMTKEEFFAKIERAEQQSARGEGMKMLPGEDLTTFLRRNGYDV